MLNRKFVATVSENSPFSCYLELCLQEKGLPRWLSVKESPVNAGDSGDAGSIPALGRSPEGGNGNPLQYSCLEYSMDRGTWKVIVHGVAELDMTERLSV